MNNKTNKKIYKRLAVAFSGPSNSGKTTLIVKVSNILQDEGYKIAIIKHDPKDKAIIDKDGKDSKKFFQTGAEVGIISPNRTTLFKHNNSSIDELIKLFDEFDFLLVEGLKTIDLPRISIFRNHLDENYFKVTNAIACDETINKDEIPKNIDILNLNSTEEIISWIKINSKKV